MANNTAYVYLPLEFQIRLDINTNIKTGSFCRRTVPNFRDYVSTAVIQYNHQTRHFRTVRFPRNESAVVLDGGTYKEDTGPNKKEEYLNDKMWTNYVVNFKFWSRGERTPRSHPNY